MTKNGLRNPEWERHEPILDPNSERRETENLDEAQPNITTTSQKSKNVRIVNFVYYVFGAIELLLLVRLIFRLLTADSTSGFGNFLYRLSYPFVVLFVSMLQNPTVGTTGILEITTLIAMVAWAVLALLIERLIRLILDHPH